MRLISKKVTPYLFIFPSMAFLFLFYYYATFLAISNSLRDVQIGFESSFTGFSNYIKIFGDVVFLYSLKNQILYTLVAIFVNLFFPLLAAELLHFIIRQKISELIKKIFVLPMLIPGIVIILIWKYLYSSNYGFNTILYAAGMGGLRHDWLNEGSTAIWSVILVGFPFVSGLYFLIIHAAINTIPKELHESGILDGCSKMDVVKYIHIPHLKPYFSMILTLVIIGSLQNYGQVAAMTNGGPGYSSMISSYYMYKVAFGDGYMGYGSALGIFILIIIIVTTLISRKLTGNK